MSGTDCMRMAVVRVSGYMLWFQRPSGLHFPRIALELSGALCPVHSGRSSTE